MKLLVTGGAGFIGSALIRYLIKQTEHEVMNVDKLTYAVDAAALAGVASDPRYHFVQADIADAVMMQQIMQDFQPDIIMHLAAETHVDNAITDASQFIHTNVLGTYTLLEAARHYYAQLDFERRQTFRFHHVSTDEVFGDLSADAPAFTEESAYRPSNPYSASKAAADHLVKAWHRTYGLPVLVSYACNNYGPYQYAEKLIPKVIAHAMAGKDIPIYGRGLQSRDWMHVDDHVRALYLIATQGSIGESYAISAATEKQNIHLVKQICAILEQLSPSEDNPNIDSYSCQPGNADSYVALIKFVPDRPGHDQRYAMKAGKLQQQLGWQAEINFEKGLVDTVAYYLRQKM